MKPIQVVPLFPQIDALLVSLLKSLNPDEWHKPTISPKWQVKDIAAHLLDGNIRALSMIRDGYFGDVPGEIHSYQDLVSYLDQLNATWVSSFRRVSPAVLIHLLESTGKEFSELTKTLDPDAKALFSVAWAGEAESKNWFHLAREYTEKWHHQQQIRLAVGMEEVLLTQEYYHPFLETSLRALPHHYRTIPGVEGERINVSITGTGGGSWGIRYSHGNWEHAESKLPCENEITVDGRIAWRLFTKGISRAQAEKYLSIKGNKTYGQHLLSLVSIMG